MTAVRVDELVRVIASLPDPEAPGPKVISRNVAKIRRRAADSSPEVSAVSDYEIVYFRREVYGKRGVPNWHEWVMETSPPSR